MTPMPKTARRPPLHDPQERVSVARIDEWDVRILPADDAKFAYFASRGFLHLQLWHAARELSILTPSRLTRGTFELWAPHVGRVTSPAWSMIIERCGSEPWPSAARLVALERWFISPHEPAHLRLLRQWWGAARARGTAARLV